MTAVPSQVEITGVRYVRAIGGAAACLIDLYEAAMVTDPVIVWFLKVTVLLLLRTKFH